MTTYAFDLDGTLDKPALAKLTNDLFDAGHEVHIVTGGMSDSGEWTMQARQEKLARLGVRYTSIQRAFGPNFNEIGRVKGEICNKLGAILIVDDAPVYLKEIGTISSVQRLFVM